MKFILSFAFLFCSIVISSFSQRVYIGGSFGNGFRAGSTSVSGTQTDGSTQIAKYSMGTGFSPTFYVGYLFNKNIGAEIGMGYMIGATSSVPNYSSDSVSGITTSNTNISGHTLFFNPSFVLRANGDKIVPYGKMGLFLGVGPESVSDQKSTNINSNDNTTIIKEDKIVYSGAALLGFTANFGADIKISNHFTCFGELCARICSFSPSSYSETVITTNNYNFGGISYNNTTANITNGNYLDHNPGTSSTDKDAITLPFSSVGFNIGMRYYFGK